MDTALRTTADEHDVPATRLTPGAWARMALVFLLVTLPGTWWWGQGGRVLYHELFVWLGSALYGAVGQHEVALVGRERFVNLVPFVALMLATPGIAWRRRATGTLLGVLAIVTTHLLLSGLTFHLRGGLASFPLYVAVVCDAVPFLAWALVCRDFVGAVIGSAPAGRAGCA